MVLECRHSPVIRVVAEVVGAWRLSEGKRRELHCRRTSSAGIDVGDQIRIWAFFGKRLEDALRHGRPTDVAETYEQNRDGGRHWDVERDWKKWYRRSLDSAMLPVRLLHDWHCRGQLEGHDGPGKGFQGLGRDASTPPTHASKLAGRIINDSHWIGLQDQSWSDKRNQRHSRTQERKEEGNVSPMHCPHQRLRQLRHSRFTDWQPPTAVGCQVELRLAHRLITPL